MEIDPDDLIDTGEVAAIVGLENPNGVSVYRRRYADFPDPFLQKGRCILWQRHHIEAWVESRRHKA